MKHLTAATFALALAAAVPSGGAMALPLTSPVPSNAYITYAGLDWAWGGPCPYSGGCYATGDLSYQSGQGRRLPTAAEMAIVDALDAASADAFANLFIQTGANVPAGGTDPVSGAYFAAGLPGADASCATPYFNTAATWCDWQDGAAGEWTGAALGAGITWSEQLYVRSIPEPASFAVLGLGLLGLGAVARRKFG